MTNSTRATEAQPDLSKRLRAIAAGVQGNNPALVTTQCLTDAADEIDRLATSLTHCEAALYAGVADRAAPVLASTGREPSVEEVSALLIGSGLNRPQAEAAADKLMWLFRSAPARELDVEAERRSYDAQVDEWAIERSNLEDEIASLKADLADARTAAQGAATQAGSAPPAYRLLDPRDIIEATDEWLANDAVTWAVNPYRLFDGHRYCEAMLPARRRVAPTPDNSPTEDNT